ncbi:hypothetical protein D3C81_2028430 [compost metagenome]
MVLVPTDPVSRTAIPLAIPAKVQVVCLGVTAVVEVLAAQAQGRTTATARSTATVT